MRKCLILRYSLISGTFPFVLSVASLVLAQPLKEVRIASNTTVSFANLSTFFARDQKFFERHGLDAKLIVFQTGASLTALMAGNIDYSTVSTSAIQAALQGMPVRLVVR